jgi:hypothetical protein
MNVWINNFQHRSEPLCSVYADNKLVCYVKPLNRRYICREQWLCFIAVDKRKSPLANRKGLGKVL